MSRRSSAPAPPIDQLTLGHLQAAVEAGVEESADLDFEERHYDDAEESEPSVQRDVAAFANNHIGGLLVIGAHEEHLRASELTPVPLPASRHRQILARPDHRKSTVDIRCCP